jgi:F-type H+-transporting ATPase subunit b
VTVEHGAAHATIADLFWPVVNFTLFAVVMVRALRGPLREYFRDRTERLKAALEAGARARRDAEALRAELARDLADLPSLRERMKADLRAAAEQESARLVDQGRLAAERIKADARLLAEQEARNARQTLRAEVIDETIRAATVLIRAALGAADQEHFVREFVEGAGAAA